MSTYPIIVEPFLLQDGIATELARDVVRDMYAGVRETMDTDRNRQTTIGLSEIGMDCTKCVARMLSGKGKPRRDSDLDGWTPMRGTMGHAYLETHFGSRPVPDGHTQVLEATLLLHEYKGLRLSGHCDYYRKIEYVGMDPIGVVGDWKFQGERKLLDTGKGKVSNQYLIQMNAYGLAWELAGEPVTHVVLFALPSESHKLADARPVLMPYDRQIVIDRLALLDTMIDAAEIAGWDAVIDAQPSGGPSGAYCWDCKRWNASDDTDFVSRLTGR